MLRTELGVTAEIDELADVEGRHEPGQRGRLI